MHLLELILKKDRFSVNSSTLNLPTQQKQNVSFLCSIIQLSFPKSNSEIKDLTFIVIPGRKQYATFA